MSATSLGYVEPTTAHLPCPHCAEYVDCPVTVVFLPADLGQVRSVTSVDDGPLWDHVAFEHGVAALFGGVS
ncbi:hypothetical protein [uncultured Friedmanniella sp.]|uniref:hypothetical protein n=1 Tax=uncultured Friedmanniella sp. TaxID=335381 RepID=UPI0035CA01AE